MAFWKWFIRKKDLEAAYLQRLRTHGRIIEGQIIDDNGTEFDSPTRIFYVYSVSGADYESSHDLSKDQRDRIADYTPGERVSVRYDPRRPENSIVV